MMYSNTSPCQVAIDDLETTQTKWSDKKVFPSPDYIMILMKLLNDTRINKYIILENETNKQTNKMDSIGNKQTQNK